MKNYAKFAAALLAAISTAAFGAEKQELIFSGPSSETKAPEIVMSEIFMPWDAIPNGNAPDGLGVRGTVQKSDGTGTRYKIPSSFFAGNGLMLVWEWAGGNMRESAINLLKEALKADTASMEKLVKNPKDAKKAEKFIKLSGLDSEKLKECLPYINVMKIGDYFALVFPPTNESKMPLGINYMVFEEVDGKLAWNPSFSDPLLGMIAQLMSASPESDQKDIETLGELNDPKINELLENSLPFLLFKNGPLISMDPDPDVYEDDISKFYKNAQDVFYSWDLDGYGKFMTQTSAEKFNSQFSSMSEEDRKKVLTDYFSWGKKYIKVMKNNYLNMIFFERVKDGEPSKNDYAYIQGTVKAELLKDGETPEFAGYKIYNFGAPKTLFDAFLGKYVLNGDYTENMKKRFKKQ